MSTALEVIHGETRELGPLAPLTVEELTAQVSLIQNVMSAVMKKDEHYGVIPGTGGKPSLLKAGAEKLSLTFHLRPEYQIQRYDLANGHREYEIVCRMLNASGELLGEGVGEATTLEAKYRYRSEDTDKEVPKDYWKYRDQALLGGPSYRAIKRNRNGRTVWIIAQRVEHTDPADYYNTVKKMAKKRAYVDAILTVTAASDIFTQDAEDQPQPQPAAAPDPGREPAGNGRPVSQDAKVQEAIDILNTEGGMAKAVARIKKNPPDWTAEDLVTIQDLLPPFIFGEPAPVGDAAE